MGLVFTCKLELVVKPAENFNVWEFNGGFSGRMSLQNTDTSYFVEIAWLINDSSNVIIKTSLISLYLLLT